MNRKEKGFTLIEVLIAMVIISVVTSALGSLLLTTMKSNRTSEARMDSAAISQNILNKYVADISGGGTVPASSTAPLSYIQGSQVVTYDLAVTTVALAGANSKEITLSVTIHHKGMGTHTFTSQAVVLEPLP